MASDVGVELARLERRIAELENNRTFRNVSIDGTTLPVYDSYGVLRQVIGVQDDGTYTVIDLNAPPPPMPSNPVVAPSLGGLVVAWDGLSATGEPWPRDFKHVEVHLSETPDFDATDLTQVGTLTSVLGGAWTVGGLDATKTYYAALVAVNTSGKESDRTPNVQNSSGTPESALAGGELEAIRNETNLAIEKVRNRPRAYYGAAPPTPPEDGFVAGDQWWKETPTETGGIGYSGFRWNPDAAGGAGWEAYEFDGRAIVADSISAAQIIADAISAHHIAADAIYAKHIKGEQVTAEAIAALAITADKLASALVIGSRITTGSLDAEGAVIGQRTELGPEGIKNIAADGTNNVFFPNDPRQTAYVNAALETASLRVKGGLVVESKGNEFASDSETQLSSGVSSPAASPQMELYWDSLQLDTTTAYKSNPDFGDFQTAGGLGTFRLDPSQITAIYFNQTTQLWHVWQQRSNGARKWEFDTNGKVAWQDQANGTYRIGDYEDYFDVTGVHAFGSPVNDAGYDIILFRYISADNWFCLMPAPNIDPTKTSEGWAMCDLGAESGWRVNPNQVPRVAWDRVNKRVLIAEHENAGAADNLVIRVIEPKYGLVPGSVSMFNATQSQVTKGYLGSGRGTRLAGLEYVEGQDGTYRFFAAAQNDVTATAINPNGTTAMTDHSFPLATKPIAFAHDGGKFVTCTEGGKLYLHSNWTWAGTENSKDKLYAGYTWYNDGTRNGGTAYETKLGRLATMTAKKRARVRITVPAVPDKGGPNDPMKFRLYVTRAAATPTDLPRLYQGPPAATTLPTTIDFAADTTGTDYPPPDPNPRDFPGSSPARFYTGLTDAAGRRKFEVDGFGRGRWPRIMPVGTVLNWTGGGTPPEGWVFADGTAASRTAYPELAALYWEGGTTYRYGNGDGTTTFNLPLLEGDYADLSSTSVVTAATGFTMVSQSFQRRGPIVSAAFGVEVVTADAITNVDHVNRLVATVGAGWRPASDMNVPSNGNGLRNAYIRASDGGVYLQAGLASYTDSSLPVGASLIFGATYMLPIDTTTGRRVRKIIYAGGNT